MQRVIPHTHLHVGGKFCLDLTALSKKLLGEYSKRWVLRSCFQEILKMIPTSTTSNLPEDGSPPKTKAPACWYTRYGWGGMSESHPAVLSRTDSSGSFFPRAGELLCLLLCTAEVVSSCFPIWKLPIYFVYICKGIEVIEPGILLSCSYKSK